MNFLTRILSTRLSHSSLSSSEPRRCIFLIQALASPQQSSFCSSRTVSTGVAKPGGHSYSTKSYVLNSPKLAKEAGAASSWRRPSEIPFQGKAANSVKLVGLVRCPVQFQTLPDGKCVAATVIAQDNRKLGTALSCSVSYVPSFLIPVVFEGDLAHVVKCHVKESDCVFISGHLSGDHLPFVVGEYEGSLHIVAQDVYFVQGVEEKAVEKISVEIKSDSKTLGASSEGFVVKEIKNSSASDVSEDNFVSVENGDQNGVSGTKDTKPKEGGTKSDEWWDVINNPNQWHDYRRRKSEGTVKAKYPDFKHKTKGDPLWLSNTTPKWVVKGLEGVDFSSEQVKRGKEEQWKSLVENPDKWWDNRSNKRNEKAPDFKNKESGEALWLNGAPKWAISKLPPLPDSNFTSAA